MSASVLNTTFDFTFPNRYVDCTHLRIHVTGVINPNYLKTRTTGFSIVDIYGNTQRSNVALAGN